jgi:hypothetical protein
MPCRSIPAPTELAPGGTTEYEYSGDGDRIAETQDGNLERRLGSPNTPLQPY